MKVTKTEIKARQFIPYTITIEITEEREHNDLYQEITRLENELNRQQGYGTRLASVFSESRTSPIELLLNEIKNHRK